MYPVLVSRVRGWRRVRGYWNHYWCVGSYGRDMAATEPLWEQNGLSPMVNIKWIASAKSHERASHHPAFMGSCLSIIHMWWPCLPSSRCVKSLCTMVPYDCTNGGSVDDHFTW